MKNASATQPVSQTIDGHPALQDELTGTEKGTNAVVPPHHRGRRRSFSTNPRLDTEITVATTGSTATRRHREFRERKVT